jgi:hypothetical protein
MLGYISLVSASIIEQRSIDSFYAASQRPKKVLLPQSTIYTLFLLLLIAIYTNLPIALGALRIEGGFALLFSIPFFVLFLRRPNNRIYWLAGLILVALLPTLLGFLNGLDPAQGIQAFAGLAASLMAAVGTSEVLLQLDRDKLARIVLIVCLFIMSAVILERFTNFFPPISDAVRSFLYQGRFVYAADTRDIALYGHIRPKAFAQEPSGPARFLAYMSFVVFALSTTQRKKLLAVLLLLLSLIVLRSPSLYACVILFAFLWLLVFVRRRTRFLPAVRLLVLLVFFGTLALASNLSVVMTMFGGARAEQVAMGRDVSTTQRLVIPPQIAAEVVRQFGVTGTGLGSKELLQPIIAPVFKSHFGTRYMKDSEGLYAWANALFDIFIYFGPIFGILFLLMIPNSFRSRFYGGVFVPFMAVFMLDGGLAGPRNWMYFAILVAGIFAFGEGGARQMPTTSRRRLSPYPLKGPR